MNRVYNFSAGPATLPESVLVQAHNELLDYHGTGMSIMEMSHRDKPFIQVAEKAEADLRKILNVPNQYKVLFLQGGGRSQFSMVPLNLLRGKKTADYLNTGMWSELATEEGKRYCEVNLVADAKENQHTKIPDPKTWKLNDKAAYFHYVDNETVHGIEFTTPPQVGDVPLVSDMSSNILSRPINIEDFGLIYGGAQKNIGPAGLTLVIVREDLIGDPLPFTPTMFNYQVHAENESMYNTPPTYPWYIAGLVFQWIIDQGGLSVIEQRNARKAKKLYQCIDESDFYQNKVIPEHRSRMNVIFQLAKDDLSSTFVKEAEQAGLSSLKGHRAVGGMRASIYNAMPESGVDVLIAFMKDFERRYG